jgi:hypothetical protein
MELESATRQGRRGCIGRGAHRMRTDLQGLTFVEAARGDGASTTFGMLEAFGILAAAHIALPASPSAGCLSVHDTGERCEQQSR